MQSVMFSKGLQNLPIEKAAEKIADMGFDGVDLTAREGGLQGWLMGLDVLKEKIRLVAIKDFRWLKEPSRLDQGFQYPSFVPLRKGTVPWYQVMKVLLQEGYDGTLSFHMEYTGLDKEEELQSVQDDRRYIEEILQRIKSKGEKADE